MKKKMILFAAMACVMALPLTNVNATSTVPDTDVKVTYDFSTTLDPTNPNYQISIPAGVVFSSASPEKFVEMNVKMLPPQGADQITSTETAEISIKSKNGYSVQLDTLDTFKDPVNYTVNYGGKDIARVVNTAVSIGALTKDNAEIKGTAALNGVATKTGAHVDTLTYIVAKN